MKLNPLKYAHITSTHMQISTNSTLIVGYLLGTIFTVLKNYGSL